MKNKINLGAYAPINQIYTADNGQSVEIGREATVESSKDALKRNMLEYDHSPIVKALRTAETVRDCKLRRIQNDIRDVEKLEQELIPTFLMEKDRQMVNREDYDASRMVAELSPLEQVKRNALEGLRDSVRPKNIALIILVTVVALVVWQYVPDVFAKNDKTLTPVTVDAGTTADSPKAQAAELEG